MNGARVRDLVDQAIDLVKAPQLESQLVVRLPDGLPFIHVDFGLLSQAIANVLHNAIVHTPPEVRIRLEAETSPGFLLLRLSDNGPGISADMLEAIFDRFARGHQAKPGGSGLGLAIAKGFIEIHGGTIQASTSPAGGATFLIRLPLEKPPDSLTLDA